MTKTTTSHVRCVVIVDSRLEERVTKKRTHSPNSKIRESALFCHFSTADRDAELQQSSSHNSRETQRRATDLPVREQRLLVGNGSDNQKQQLANPQGRGYCREDKARESELL